ncbi:MAG: isochorismatase family protein [Deltaproteobacteria bacterium]|nr:isochorismatase family protein [Deltaproteobacteria bacterium]
MVDVLNREEALLLVVDVQERLVKAIDEDLYASSAKNMRIAIEAAAALGLPIFLTEQYPKGLGRTVPEIGRALDGKAFRLLEKITFSCARDEAFLAALSSARRRQVVIVGMETHVCVYQTSVDLIRTGYSVFVLDDAVSSRFRHNYLSGLHALRDAGATVYSTETALFQLLRVAATPEFRTVSALIK